MRKLSSLTPNPDDLTVVQAAQVARVHPSTIRRWLTEGLEGYRWGRGGRVMIRPEELARFLEKHRQL
jgi:excisionase family DNA binding protein